MKCRMSGLQPSAAVVVATVRALKAHSGRHSIKPGKPLPPELLAENPDEVAIGGANLRKHLENLKKFGVTPVVAINAFPTDHDSEHEVIAQIAAEAGARSAVATHVVDGGAGAVDLARVVEEVANEPNDFKFLYPLEDTIEKKIETIATSLYGATGTTFTPAAAAQAKRYQELGYGHLPIVIAKTHLSITSDASLLGHPRTGDLFRCASCDWPPERVHLRRLRRHSHHARPLQPPGGGADRHRRRRQHRRTVLAPRSGRASRPLRS